jgi:hypothetical protein
MTRAILAGCSEGNTDDQAAPYSPIGLKIVEGLHKAVTARPAS